MAGIKTVPHAAELLKSYVEDGRLEVKRLKKSARGGTKASRIALEMLIKEGFEI